MAMGMSGWSMRVGMDWLPLPLLPPRLGRPWLCGGVRVWSLRLPARGGGGVVVLPWSRGRGGCVGVGA